MNRTRTCNIRHRRRRLDVHQFIHSNAGGNWNREWENFFKDVANKNATAETILEHMNKLVKDFGIDGVPK